MQPGSDYPCERGPRRQALRWEEIPTRIGHRRLAKALFGHRFLYPPRAIDRLFTHLARYLSRQIGRPWGKVLSEIDARCRKARCDRYLAERARARLLLILFDDHPAPRGLHVCGGRLFIDPDTGRVAFTAGPSRPEPQAFGLDELRTEPELIL